MNFEIPQNSSEYETNIDLFWNKNVLKQCKDGNEIRNSRSEVFCKKGVSKNFKKFSDKYLCWSQESLVKGSSCEFCRVFRNIYFVEHLWTHIYVKWSNEKMFWQIYLQKTTGDGLLWSTVVGLRTQGINAYSFTLKGPHRYFLVKLVTFCRASVLHNTTYYWASASDFQQHFWRITFFISNISIQSQLDNRQ